MGGDDSRLRAHMEALTNGFEWYVQVSVSSSTGGVWRDVAICRSEPEARISCDWHRANVAPQHPWQLIRVVRVAIEAPLQVS